MCACVYVHLYASVYVRAHMYVYLHMHPHVSICVYPSVSACAHAFFGVFVWWARATVCEFQLSAVEKQRV